MSRTGAENLAEAVHALNKVKKARKNVSSGLSRITKKIDYSISYVKGPLMDEANKILKEAGLDYKFDPSQLNLIRTNLNDRWVAGDGRAIQVDVANAEIFRIADMKSALTADNNALRTENAKIDEKIGKQNDKILDLELKWERELAEITPLPPLSAAEKLGKRKAAKKLSKKNGRR